MPLRDVSPVAVPGRLLRAVHIVPVQQQGVGSPVYLSHVHRSGTTGDPPCQSAVSAVDPRATCLVAQEVRLLARHNPIGVPPLLTPNMPLQAAVQ